MNENLKGILKGAGIGLGVVIVIYAIFLFIAKNNNPKIFYVNYLGKDVNGSTIYPFGIFILKSRKGNKQTLAHEMEHWRQNQNEGFFKFNIQYAKETRMNGYYNNKYEVQARNAGINAEKSV